MPNTGLSNFAYPFLQLDGSRSVVLHNLVVQVLVLGLCLATMSLALEEGRDKTLVAIKVVQVLAMIGTVVFTGATLARDTATRAGLRKAVSLTSFASAVVAIVLGVSFMAARLEYGTTWWLELTIVLIGVFWTWRTAGQSLHPSKATPHALSN